MYLHLGQESIVRTRDILGIFDLDTLKKRSGYVDGISNIEK